MLRTSSVTHHPNPVFRSTVMLHHQLCLTWFYTVHHIHSLLSLKDSGRVLQLLISSSVTYVHGAAMALYYNNYIEQFGTQCRIGRFNFKASLAC